MHFDCLNSPLGCIGVYEQNGQIVRITLMPEKDDRKLSPSSITAKAAAQLTEYFLGKRKKFDIPFSFEDETPFRQKVYSALLQVPYGKTVSYKELAAMIGNPNASRAVGGALNKNPLLIIVPCHRVLGSNGSLTGFAAGTDKKQFLIQLEKKNIN